MPVEQVTSYEAIGIVIRELFKHDNHPSYYPLFLFRFSPTAQAAHWYASAAHWKAMYCEVETGEKQPKPKRPGARKIQWARRVLRTITTFDKALLHDMQMEHVEDRTLVKAVFSTTQNVTPSGSGRDWFHAILQALVFDRLVWMTHTKDDEADDRPQQIPHMAYNQTNFENPKVQNYVNLQSQWQRVMNDLCKTWFERLTKMEDGTVVIFQGASPYVQRKSRATAEDIDPVFDTLTEGMRSSMGSRHLTVVQHNMCQAAAALRGIIVVSFHL